MNPLGYIGEQRDLLIRQGAIFEPVSVQYVDDNGAPISLVGCSISGAIKKRWNEEAVAAEVTFHITDALAGRFNFTIPASETAKLVAGVNASAPASQYVWQADIIDAGGTPVALYRGDVSVLRDIGID